MLHRENGRPARAGNSQASALTATTTSGGKSPGATRAGMILETGQALFEKALAPEGHDLPPGVQTPGDRVIGAAFGRQEDHLGADDLKMGSRIGRGSPLQHPCFLSRQDDLIGTGSRHRSVAIGLAPRVPYSRFQYKQKTLAYLRNEPLSLAHGDARAPDGNPLKNGTDGGGRRDFLAGRPVHAGETLFLLTCAGWHPVRYESNFPASDAVLYLPLPGVRKDVVIDVPRDARLAWPEELR